MEKLKYFFEFGKNRELPEEEQGFAEISLITNKEKNILTNAIMEEAVRNKNSRSKTFEYANKSEAINQRHIGEIVLARNPLTDEIHEKLSISELYEMPEFNELYEELSNAVGDINILKDGIKKK